MLTPAFLAQVDEAAPAQHQQAVWDSVGTASQLNTMLAYDWRYTLAESDLPKVRETTRLAGVGVGFPMLDSALLDFSLTLPDDFKLKGMKLRWFFKEALRGFLPDEILTKKKQGFGLPFGVWTTRNEALKTLARDSVEGLVSRGIVQAEFSRRLFEVQLHEHPGYYGEMIWILMMLEQWLRVHAPEFRI
jgi:asparagine synthase (glutamine-hydrolysing)